MAENGLTVEGSTLERARWPWFAFATFLVTFVAGMVFHVLNGEGVVTTVPFALAFAMFAVVGLVVVTRDPHNRVGLLLLVGSLIMVVCSSAGDFATWALSRGYEGPLVAIPGLTTNFGWLLGLIAPLLLIPLLFPDGRLPSPHEILAEFSGRMGEAYEDGDVLPRMSRVLGEGIGAEHAEVWLHVGEELRVAASWPDDSRHVAPVGVGSGPLPQLPGADAAYPVNHQGELLGALSVAKPASEPLTPADLALVSDLADQAGLVLRNVRLTEHLRARLDDLQGAQTRIVRAQDEERRKLERNIHDGAQQQLVALAVKLRLADSLVGRDDEAAHRLLHDLQTEAGDALNDLRDLARGIYPPLLADKGLTAALDAQARKAAVPTTVVADGVGRFSQDIEATVYFSCLEALQNIAKYAEASAATVTLRSDDGRLEFTVSDDGRGFDPTATGYGTGLQGIADRVAAAGGAIEVRSAPGAGTSLTGRLPTDG